MAADIIARRIEALGLADDRLKERIAAIQRTQGASPATADLEPDPHGVFLFGLPAQYLD